jgi:hypothetical protein
VSIHHGFDIGHCERLALFHANVGLWRFRPQPFLFLLIHGMPDESSGDCADRAPDQRAFAGMPSANDRPGKGANGTASERASSRPVWRSIRRFATCQDNRGCQ